MEARGLNQSSQHILIDGDLNVPLPDEIDAWHAYHKQLLRCINHKMTPSDILEPACTIEAVVNRWMYEFHAGNFVVPDVGIASTDLLFAVLCHHKVAEHNNNDDSPMTIPTIKDIFPLLQTVRCLSCQHTEETFSLWPSKEEMGNLFHRIALAVVYIMWDGGISQSDRNLLSARLKRETECKTVIRSDDIATVEVVYKHNPVAEHIEQLISRLKFKAKRKDGTDSGDFIITTNVFGETTKKRRVDSEDQKGAIWSEMIPRIVGQFLPVCSRVFAKYQLDEEIFDKYTYVEESEQDLRWKWRRLHIVEYENRVRTWVKAKKRTLGESNKFKEAYKSLVYELLLPMGCRQDSFKNTQDMYSFKQPYTLFGEQLGNNAVTHTHTQVDAAYDPDERPFLFQFASVTCLAYELFQQKRVLFYSDYFIGDTQLYSKHEMLGKVHVNYRPRRPMLVRIRRKWFLHERSGEWLCCGNNAYRAIAMWCGLIFHEFNETLEDDKNISSILQEIIKPKG